jgi:hypothetical protein
VERHHPTLSLWTTGSSAAGLATVYSDLDLTLTCSSNATVADPCTAATSTDVASTDVAALLRPVRLLQSIARVVVPECGLSNPTVIATRGTASSAPVLHMPTVSTDSTSCPALPTQIQSELTCTGTRTNRKSTGSNTTATSISATATPADVVTAPSSTPSLLQCVDCTGLCVDIAIRHGSGGLFAGVDKSLLLADYCIQTPLLQCLVLLVKQWGRSRELIDPLNGQVNSFTLTLMATFFLQTTGVLHTLLDCTLPARMARRIAHERNIKQPSTLQPPLHSHRRPHLHRSTASAPLPPPHVLIKLVQGFFAYWRQFQFGHQCASVRCGKIIQVSESPSACASAARSSVDGHCAPPTHSFVVEDPCEPDENTVRYSSF